MTPLQEAARRYAAMGLHIFPLAPRTKIPMKGSHGHHDAKPDASPWDRHPNANIGINCKASGIVGIDEDVANGIADAGWKLDPTWTWYGRRGRTLLYRVPEACRPSIKTIKGRVDVKWNGLIVPPPSVHPITKLPYHWDHALQPGTMEIAELRPEYTELDAGAASGFELGRELVGDAVDTFLGVAFEAAGWLGQDLGGGRSCVRCPWVDEHTDGRGWGRDSSTVLFAPTAGKLRIGTFLCSHSHCRDRKTEDVLKELPITALRVATKHYGDEIAFLKRMLARVENGSGNKA